MSSKNRNRPPRGTDPAAHTDAPAGRTDNEDRLWAALHAHPHSAVTELATLAKIGRSTAQKILARWAADGSVTRTPGIAEGGRRAPDSWAITEAPLPEVSTSTDSAATTTESHPPAREAARESSHEADKEDATPGSGTSAEETARGTNPPLDDGQKADRLAPGALRGMVEDYLRDHPDDEFGPTAIAKALGGKSSGAVSNALDKLVLDGTAVRTKDKPRRFRLAPDNDAPSQASMN
ncbi:MarR family transcriptional regulator [Amycolatopsis thermoflava]|uniref:MarR family transcriptional regulator n=1 Tax=Amycolatopsis thermoflava TaxID=84480 RepID=UPI000688686A|nr:helix-turn-helix domain-containing protein [Amycolatopsis thermoflava]